MALDSRNIVEGLDHAKYGAQQSQQRADGRDGVEHADVLAQSVGGTLARVEHRLFDLDGRLAPFAHGAGEDLGRRAAIFIAKRQRRVAVQLSFAQLVQESFDKRLWNDSSAAQGDRAFEDEDHHHERTAENRHHHRAAGLDDLEQILLRNQVLVGEGRRRKRKSRAAAAADVRPGAGLPANRAAKMAQRERRQPARRRQVQAGTKFA